MYNLWTKLHILFFRCFLRLYIFTQVLRYFWFLLLQHFLSILEIDTLKNYSHGKITCLVINLRKFRRILWMNAFLPRGNRTKVKYSASTNSPLTEIQAETLGTLPLTWLIKVACNIVNNVRITIKICNFCINVSNWQRIRDGFHTLRHVWIINAPLRTLIVREPCATKMIKGIILSSDWILWFMKALKLSPFYPK